jgi:hypothetical protein
MTASSSPRPTAGRHWTRQLDGRQAAALMVERYGAQAAQGNPELKAALAEAQRMQAAGPDLPFLDVWFEDERTGYAVGAFNLLFATNDGGLTWQPASDRVDNPQAHHLYTIRGHGNDVYVAGELGLLLKLDRSSRRFAAVATPYKGTWFGIAVKPGVVIAHGLRGNAWRSRDGGATWRQVVMPVQTASPARPCSATVASSSSARTAACSSAPTTATRSNRSPTPSPCRCMAPRRSAPPASRSWCARGVRIEDRP